MNLIQRFSLSMLAVIVTLQAQPATDYLIAEAPIGVRSATNVLWVKWMGRSRNPLDTSYKAPDSGTIYFDRSPGGGNLNNYRYKITVPWTDTVTDTIQDNIYFKSSANQPAALRGTAFKVAEQPGMGTGVFYCIVALPLTNDTLVSNEFQIFIESPNAPDWEAPSGTITELTPTFKWKANAGVPYYHIILSDEAIAIDDSSSGKINVQGLSIIWQAITPNTQMVYGAPDPSKTLTADPPPLSPGQRYTWIVLNNYGNHPAFSSTKIKIPPGEFTLGGVPLRTPKPIYPVNDSLNVFSHDTFEFKWTNLDSLANTYKIYVYVGSDFEGINAKMAVWQGEVTAGVFKSIHDTMKVKINASSVLTSNKYVWRVIAVDNQGAGTAGDTASFYYKAPTGTMNIYTKEIIIAPKQGGGFDTVKADVGLAKINVEVLDGSMEAPLLFYTDDKGKLSRTRPIGTYRVTAVKDGFENLTRTIVLGENATTIDTFYMERPEATVYGKVVDEANKGLNLARVYGVSDRGDTVSTNTDALGNFILNCYAADWNIGAELTGYKPSMKSKITVTSGQSYPFPQIALEKNPFTLSGIVKNTSNIALLGVKVRILRDGILIDEVPSTPQTGAFSFTVPSGTYTITADKAGFTSYSGDVTVLSSKSITISMAPGATMINGYIYGKSYVNAVVVHAPITNASVIFVNDTTGDSIKAISDATYGDFKVSLPGAQTFKVLVSAQGFALPVVVKKIYTTPKATQQFADTLKAFAMISGQVRLAGSAVGNASVILTNVATEQVASSAKTSADGRFELRGLPDATYTIIAGKEGLVLDSIVGPDTFTVADGQPSSDDIRIHMKAGDKTLKWFLKTPTGLLPSVKIQSPIIKTMAISDSLAHAGTGVYITNVDAPGDSIVDLSYHRFAIADSETVHIDSISLIVRHKKTAKLQPIDGKVNLTLTSVDSLDSAYIYYKDIAGATFSKTEMLSRAKSYTFEFKPPRDGSTMMYYFKAYAGRDVYGYEKETYAVDVAPDTSRLTRFEITPIADTLKLASEQSLSFSFRGYYSSSYIFDSTIDPSSISWSLVNAQGSKLENNKGLTSVVKTGGQTSSGAVLLVMSIDTLKTKVVSGSPISDTIRFLVSGSKLKRIVVSRIDAKNPNPITTSATDLAEFKAEGVDESGNVLSISPKWQIIPSQAGAISSEGVYRPAPSFVGHVRIIASSGDIHGEYNPRQLDKFPREEAGLTVRYMLTEKSKPDTTSNKQGCSIIFPANAVEGSDYGIIDVSVPDLRNEVYKGLGKTKMIDSVAYDITQLENVTLNIGSDSINLVLDIPSDYVNDALSGSRKFIVGRWNEELLQWDTVGNSVVASDGKTISAKLAHFSRYAILTVPQKSAFMSVSPTPFSPYIRPVKEYGPMNAQYGTCIKFNLDDPSLRLQSVMIRIFNSIGDQVWGLEIQNAQRREYSVWWDGRTSDGMIRWNKPGFIINEKGELMCRNGRYFVLLTVKDIEYKERRLMKQIVLMK